VGEGGGCSGGSERAGTTLTWYGTMLSCAVPQRLGVVPAFSTPPPMLTRADIWDSSREQEMACPRPVRCRGVG
jgi:hypothetical protein